MTWETTSSMTWRIETPIGVYVILIFHTEKLREIRYLACFAAENEKPDEGRVTTVRRIQNSLEKTLLDAVLTCANHAKHEGRYDIAKAMADFPTDQLEEGPKAQFNRMYELKRIYAEETTLTSARPKKRNQAAKTGWFS